MNFSYLSLYRVNHFKTEWVTTEQVAGWSLPIYLFGRFKKFFPFDLNTPLKPLVRVLMEMKETLAGLKNKQKDV